MKRFGVIMAICCILALSIACGNATKKKLVSMFIEGTSMLEGDTGTHMLMFRVSISSYPEEGKVVTVNWDTNDGTATTADNDYEAASGSLTFTNSGELFQDIGVIIFGDNSFEADEQFSVELTGPVNANITDSSGEGIIQNDDPDTLPDLSISEVEGDEGNSGTKNFDFIISLSKEPAVGMDVTLDWATSDGLAKSSDNDYTAANGSLTFTNGGALTQTVSISVKGDLAYEVAEQFSLHLTNISNATSSNSTGEGTINNDDPIPTISISNAEISEGNLDDHVLVYAASSDFGACSHSGYSLSCKWETLPGTASEANGDFKSSSGTLTFTGEGPQTQTISITIKADELYELDETFFIKLSNPVNATIANDQATGTIKNDDEMPTVSIETTKSVPEGNSGISLVSIAVSISKDISPGYDVSVDWSTVDGTATVDDNDYQPANGTVTFNPGGTSSINISIPIVGDEKSEADEDFIVDFFDFDYATVANTNVTVRISNDDTPRWLVDPSSTGTENGATWTTAFHSIQDAVDEASSQGGGQVWVAAATYNTSGGGAPVITMKEYVDIHGGFSGYNNGTGAFESQLSQRDWENNTTLLDGDDSVYHVVVGANYSTLDGFSVIGGSSNGSYPDDCGAGMINVGVSPTVSNCDFSNNNAGNYGGGVYNYNFCSPVFTNCTFFNNSADNYGGGVFNGSYATASFIDSVFENNLSANVGGAMYNNSSSSIISKCDFINNSSKYGAAIYNYSEGPFITNCLFKKNSAITGGAIYNGNGSDATIVNSLFYANSALNAGGAIYNVNSSPSIINCSLLSNTSRSCGGIYNYDSSSPTITNCIVWNNNDAYGIPQISDVENSNATVTYCNVQGGHSGTGNINSDPMCISCPVRTDVTVAEGTTTTLEIQGATVNYNVGDSLQLNNEATVRTVSAVSGTTVTFTPALSSTSRRDTQVHNWGSGTTNMTFNLFLNLGSPCIDAGDSSAVPDDTADLDGDSNTTERIPLDLAENDRFVDDPVTTDSGPAEFVMDIGAYEYQPPPP